MASLASQRFSANTFSGFGASSRRAASSTSYSRSLTGYSGYGASAGYGASGGYSYRAASGGLSYGASAGGSSSYGLSYGGGYGISSAAAGGGLSAGWGAAAGLGGVSVGGYGLSSSVGGGYLFKGPALESGPSAFAVNEKKLLQALNDRLAAYLDKVKMLETVNAELEQKVKAFTLNNIKIRDLKVYEDKVTPLRQQVLILIQECSNLRLTLDSTKLTADDFRTKYESEYTVRQSVEADVNALRQIKMEYDFIMKGMAKEVQVLTDQLTTLRKSHEEDMVKLRGEMVGTVNVDVKAASSADLKVILEELRVEYEAVVKQNHEEVQSWYTAQMQIEQQERKQTTETTVTTSTEIVELRKQSHNLQTELNNISLSKASVEERFVDVQTQYRVQLQRLNNVLLTLESELSNVRQAALQQLQEYQNLLNVKMKLEMEISTYSQMIDTVAPTDGSKVMLMTGGGAAGGAGGAGGAGVAGGAAISGGGGRMMFSASSSQSSSSATASSTTLSSE